MFECGFRKVAITAEECDVLARERSCPDVTAKHGTERAEPDGTAQNDEVVG
jgi:hypothetical protein